MHARHGWIFALTLACSGTPADDTGGTTTTSTDSYSRPTEPFRGDVRLLRVTLQ